jgi:SAM-dependent methyltransferase
MSSRAHSGVDAAGPKWPKFLPPLTEEQQWISDDFIKAWLEVLPNKYQLIESFNHGYPVKHAPQRFARTLEIGAGLGEHLQFEHLTEEQRQNYFTLELRENVSYALAQRYPTINTITGDCQQRLDFPDGFFDRILAIHVLEHLPNLPSAVREMHRLCNKENGVFSVVIPCEGGLAYGLARRISAQRLFERRYPGQSYNWYISREHINRPDEMLEELGRYFTIEHQSFFPLLVPIVTINLCIGLTLRPRTTIS